MSLRQKSDRETDLLNRAAKVLPAGGFGNFDPSIVIARGAAGRVWDESGNDYVDYLIGSGPMLVGHSHPEVLEAVAGQIAKGQTFFASNAAGIELAEVICDAMSCADQVRYVSTGSEADMYAMRLARAHTGREKILKFEGGYHGMSAEALMSTTPSRRENFPTAVPDTAGTPASVRDQVLVAPYNDAAAVRALVDEYGAEIAAIIVEPLQRLIPPQPGFLQALREITAAAGIILIFDEVVTGFRLAYGGGQEAYGVTPDLCTLGKVIGGGFPMAAIAGRAEIMAHFDKGLAGPDGFVFQVGTLSGNPVAAAAGLKSIEILRRPGAYERIEATGKAIMEALADQFDRVGIPHRVVGAPCMFDIVFTDADVTDYRSNMNGDAALLNRFNALMRERGILKSSAKFYISLAHDEADIARTIAAITETADIMAAET